MKALKTVIKLILGLGIGVVAGLLIAAVGLMLFTDTTFTEFIGNLRSTALSEILPALLVGMLSFAFSIAVLIPVHEAGHLVCGLLSGYRFVSFRIFNFTFIRKAGRLEVKRYSIAGTGGQCLLTPPDLPLEKVPVVWYNLGGILANVVIMLAVLPLLWICGNPFVKEALAIFIVSDAFIILINGIPMKMGGMSNDACNVLLLRKNLESKRGFVTQLRANSLTQNGIRPKDMPAEWFEIPDNVDYGNALELSLPLMAASRLLDEKRYDEARCAFESLYTHKDEMIQLFVKEIECELVYLRLIAGDTASATALLDEKLRKYITDYRKVMSSKERILCAVALYVDGDEEEARRIYENLLSRKSDYLLQGEVESDLCLMEDMFSRYAGKTC